MAENQLLTPKEAAERLQVSIRTLEAWRKKDIGLRYYVLNTNTVRYSHEGILEFLQHSQQGAK